MGGHSREYRLSMLPAIQAILASDPQLSVGWEISRPTDHGAVAVLYGWEGNRGSGVTLAMHHRLVVYLPRGSVMNGEGRSATSLHSYKVHGKLYLLSF